MGKKRNAPAAGTSISQDIHDLKTLNSDLVKEVAELRKQIEHLCSRLDSLIADHDIPDSINRDISDSTDHDIPDSTDRGVLDHILSSTLGEAEAHSNAQIAEATYKVESATAELNAIEIPLLREQDAVERELELIIEGSDITQYSLKVRPEKTRKEKWIFYPIVITAIVLFSTAVVSLCKSSKLKK